MSEEEERNGNSADRVSGLTKGQNSKLWVCVLVWITKRNDSILMGRRCKLGELCSHGDEGIFFYPRLTKGCPLEPYLLTCCKAHEGWPYECDVMVDSRKGCLEASFIQ